MPRTKNTTEPEANRVQIRGLGQLYRRQTGGSWYVSFSLNGQQVRESAGSIKYNEAVAHLKRRISEAQTGTFTTVKAERVLVSDILQDVLDDYRLKGRDVGKSAGPIITQHLIPGIGSQRAASVTVSHLRHYISAQRAAGMSDASINRHMALLRRGYSLAVAAGRVNASSVPAFRQVVLEENNVREGFWEHDEYQRFRDALPADERPVFVFGYWTGCRYSEITGLRWEQVDLARGIVKLRQGETKNGQARLIPVGTSGDLYEVLVSQQSRHALLCPSSPWVFFRHGAITPGRASARRGQRVVEIRKAFDAAQESTGIAKSFHDLRRTGVRNLIRSGVPQAIAKRISGHLTDSVFERYNIVDETDLRDAAEKLGRYVRGKAAGI